MDGRAAVRRHTIKYLVSELGLTQDAHFVEETYWRQRTRREAWTKNSDAASLAPMQRVLFDSTKKESGRSKEVTKEGEGRSERRMSTTTSQTREY